MILDAIQQATLLEYCAGLGYLIGHYYMSKEISIGWIIKAFGASCWVAVLFLNHHYLFMSVTIVVVMSLLYGYWKWHQSSLDTYTPVDKFFHVLAIIITMIILLFYLDVGTITISQMLEVFIALGEVYGSLLLARKRIAGWYCLIFMSSAVGILMMFFSPTPAIVLGTLEMCSIYFYVQGIRNFSH